jgi:hypothetical protein
VAVMPAGKALPSWGIAASTASGLILKMGNFGWFLALFFGFWIMYSTAISNVDLVVRQSTDMLWFASPGLRKWAKEDIRKIYYGLLIVFVIWGLMYVNITLPLIIFAVSANIANFTMALSALLTIRLNRKVLPKEFRPAVWREVVLVLNIAFFGFFFSMFILLKVLGIKF